MTNAPCTQNFNAWVNLQPPGPSKLIVTGEVETNAGNLVPGLTRADLQGINPQQLILDLGINDTGGIGTQDVAFRDVRYEEPAGENDFTSVAIRWHGDIIETLTVQKVS